MGERVQHGQCCGRPGNLLVAQSGVCTPARERSAVGCQLVLGRPQWVSKRCHSSAHCCIRCLSMCPRTARVPPQTTPPAAAAAIVAKMTAVVMLSSGEGGFAVCLPCWSAQMVIRVPAGVPGATRVSS